MIATILTILLQETVERPITIWGVAIPAVVFIISFVATLMMYRHFSQPEEEQ